jgi:hypothetical protein
VKKAIEIAQKMMLKEGATIMAHPQYRLCNFTILPMHTRNTFNSEVIPQNRVMIWCSIHGTLCIAVLCLNVIV